LCSLLATASGLASIIIGAAVLGAIIALLRVGSLHQSPLSIQSGHMHKPP
jgi:hypothetical protein